MDSVHLMAIQLAPVAWAAALIVMILKELLPRLLIALGIGFVVFQGVDLALDQIETIVQSNLSALGGDLVAWAAFLNIDKAISMILSAYSIRLTIRGLTGGALRKWRFNPPV